MIICEQGIRYRASLPAAMVKAFSCNSLKSLKNTWQNTPPSWGNGDPCGTPWEGVTCKNSRVTALIPAGCGFTGSIPDELGNLAELSFLALHKNNLTGKIPSSLAKLSNFYWLDLADNHLTGPIRVSTPTTPGLDLLRKAKHLLFDGNLLDGTIPSTLGLVQTLEEFSNNKLKGPLPDLTGMNALNYENLSNKAFFPSEAPAWFSTLPSLTTLILKNNAFSGQLDMGESVGPLLQLVDLQNNNISSEIQGALHSQMLVIVNNSTPAASLANLSKSPRWKARTVR
ncbi:hypothetical protein JCGZ_26682 [Jatropha curcas]|uniref:Leucine-rich repeat-containing N-terminal plant-type domain-containing protein n=1 Tax=Jatropha curcas TaxID=180498 RepID=A0A067LG71_JATCU|nr:hypothetical protein JCGZ_26682 [Jatropha curcas]